MKKGQIICFTGIDGSGKTTQAKKLLNALKEKNIDAIYSWTRREPYLIKPIVALVKRILKEPSKSEGKSYLNIKKKRKGTLFKFPLIQTIWIYVAIIDYFAKLIPQVYVPLFKGKIVICDRYVSDMIADFVANFDYNSHQIRQLLKNPLLKLFPMPDKVFYIKIPASLGYKRKSDGTSLEYLLDREKIYDFLAKEMNMFVVDGTRDIEEIFKKIKAEIGI